MPSFFQNQVFRVGQLNSDVLGPRKSVLAICPRPLDFSIREKTREDESERKRIYFCEQPFGVHRDAHRPPFITIMDRWHAGTLGGRGFLGFEVKKGPTPRHHGQGDSG